MKQCGVKKTSSTFRTFVFVYFYFFTVAKLTQKLSYSRGAFIFSTLLTEKKCSLKFLHYQTRLLVIDFFLKCLLRLSANSKNGIISSERLFS